MVAYLYLLAAIAAEVFATSTIKSTEGFSRLWPTLACAAGYIISFLALAQAVKGVQVGVAYAIWSGLGTALTALVGCCAFNDRLSGGAWLGLGFVITGVVLLSIYLPRAD